MCSRAVDYAKHGNPIDLDTEKLPRFLIPFKPDWHKAEVTNPHDNDYYVSDRALGHLYRAIQLPELDAPVDIPFTQPGPPLSDPISLAIYPMVQRILDSTPDGEPLELDTDMLAAVSGLFAHYSRELRYIRYTHTLTDAPDVKLAEEEIILGVILSTCTQKRWREDRVFKMKTHTDSLVRDVRERLEGSLEEGNKSALLIAVRRSWAAWEWSQENMVLEGAVSFGLLVLGTLLDCLKKLDVLPVPLPQMLPVESDSDGDDDW
jgi:RNA-dependent RNA polymerase